MKQFPNIDSKRFSTKMKIDSNRMPPHTMCVNHARSIGRWEFFRVPDSKLNNFVYYTKMAKVHKGYQKNFYSIKRIDARIVRLLDFIHADFPLEKKKN